MKEHTWIIIKPDGISRALAGQILTKLVEAKLDLVAARVTKVSRHLAEQHYKHLRNQPFFRDVINYLCGKYHKQKYVMALIFSGQDAIRKCRTLAGATHPEDADSMSIRGKFGRITKKGMFENVLHVSSDAKEAKREIKLWFNPCEVVKKLCPTKQIIVKSQKKVIWA